MKKKVLICCLPGDYSGVPIYTRSIVEALDDTCDFSIFTSSNQGVFDNISAKIIQELRLKNSFSLLAVAVNLFLFMRVVKRVKPDIVHLNGSMFGLIGRIASLCVRRKFIFTYHGLPWGAGRSKLVSIVMISIECFLLNVSNSKSIAISKMDLRRLTRLNIFKRCIHYIPNSVSIQGAQSLSHQSINISRSDCLSAKKIVTIARFSRQKNFTRLFQAFNILPDDYKLSIVGAGTDGARCAELASMICSPKKILSIEFKGVSTDVTSLLKNATVFCLSSDYEGMPLSAIEAMSVGLPIIIPAVGGSDEFEDCGAAVVYKPNTANALASTLVNVCEDQKKLDEMSQSGVRGYKDIFSLKVFRARILSLYESL